MSSASFGLPFASSAGLPFSSVTLIVCFSPTDGVGFNGISILPFSACFGASGCGGSRVSPWLITSVGIATFASSPDLPSTVVAASLGNSPALVFCALTTSSVAGVNSSAPVGVVYSTL